MAPCQVEILYATRAESEWRVLSCLDGDLLRTTCGLWLIYRTMQVTLNVFVYLASLLMLSPFDCTAVGAAWNESRTTHPSSHHNTRRQKCEKSRGGSLTEACAQADYF